MLANTKTSTPKLIFLQIDFLHGKSSKYLKYESVDCLSNDHLPTGHEVLQYLLCMKASNSGRKINNLMIVAELVLNWVYCNVYIQNIHNK